MHRIQFVRIAPAVLLSLFASLAYSATIVTVPDSIDDYEPQKRSDTGVYIASENFGTGSRIGFQSNFNGAGASAPGGIASLFFFQLPALPAGETLTSATFSVSVLPDSASTAVTPTFNSDLYILGVISPISKTATDAQKFWYIGNAAQASLPSGGPMVGGAVSLVADNFLLPTDFIANGGSEGPLKTASMTSYIQDLYNNPGPNGFTPGTSFLVVRVNPDPVTVPTSGTQRYTLAFQGTSTNGGAGTNRPTIQLETVPEPSSLVLLLAAGLGLLVCRQV